MKILINKIKPNPQQPRQSFNPGELQELADSIKENGLLQPITVEDHGDHFILVSGERRIKAHELLGLTEIEAHIIPPTNHNGQQLLINAIVENVQRVDMNPIEEARAYERLKNVFGISTNDIARMIGKHETQVYNRTDLLKYDQEIVEMIERNTFPSSSQLAHAIMQVPDKNVRLKIARKVQNGMKLQVAIMLAQKMGRMLSEKSLSSTESPAIELARRHGNYSHLDRIHAPTNWDIRVVTGGFPKWDKMFDSANAICGRCSLRDVASEENCGMCPLSEFLVEVVKP